MLNSSKNIDNTSDILEPEQIGALIIGLDGWQLSKQEKEYLAHPMVAGVILFTRNYQNRKQLQTLCNEINAINPKLLISVDQEGGRVQRFREDFSVIPAMRTLGKAYESAADLALQTAQSCGYLIAAELKALGIDFSYAPVCDIDYQRNPAIGNRAFSGDITAACALSNALYQGMKEAGSIGVAKHFPGHGFVEIDSHLGIPQDDRSLAELHAKDLRPFINLIAGNIEAIMPAHIIFSCLDKENTVLNSSIWLKYLRQELGFKGLIISDDMNMKGVDNISGDDASKAQQCFKNGVDILLCCNQKSTIQNILAAFNTFEQHPNPDLITRLQSYKNIQTQPFNLEESSLWQQHRHHLDQFNRAFPT